MASSEPRGLWLVSLRQTWGNSPRELEKCVDGLCVSRSSQWDLAEIGKHCSNGEITKLGVLHLSSCGQGSFIIFSFNSSKEAEHAHGDLLRNTVTKPDTDVIIACVCV